MASVKVVLRRKKNKDGTFPLALRITKDRRSSYIHLGHSIEEKYWSEDTQTVKKSHPNSARLNNFIAKKMTAAQGNLLELEGQQRDSSSQAIIRKIKAKNATFFTLADPYLENLKQAGKFNRYAAEKPLLNRFKEFLKGQDITFQDITVGLLNRYKTYLKGTRKIKEQTALNHLVVIRTVFNQAIGANLIDAKYYPFGRNKIVARALPSLKIGLSSQDVKNIEHLNVSQNKSIDHAKNIWLVSFYFAGMRVSDVLRLKWSDIQHDRLYYTMGKNEKVGSLKIADKAMDILNQYKVEKYNHGLIFPDLNGLKDLKNTFETQRHIALAVKRINASLKKIATLAEIKTKLTMHIARHTFGNISGDKIPIQMLQKLYRHSSITTTIGYQANFINKDADDALEAVIG